MRQHPPPTSLLEVQMLRLSARPWGHAVNGHAAAAGIRITLSDPSLRTIERSGSQRFDVLSNYYAFKLTVLPTADSCSITSAFSLRRFTTNGDSATCAIGSGTSLKKEYDPEGVDRLTERVVRMVESGQI